MHYENIELNNDNNPLYFVYKSVLLLKNLIYLITVSSNE